MNKSTTLLAIAAACATASGCGGFKQAVGAEKVAPDEFRVVSRAPLSLPPDYALRPPRPGDARPQELRADDQARAAVFGRDIGAQASAGEQVLVARAGGDAIDPAIRAQIDVEGGDVVHKDEGFADRILSFGAKPDEGKPLDPAAEQKRLADMESIRRTTGGGDVVIQKGGGGFKTKLPGL